MTLLLWIVLSSILCKVSGTAGFISTLIGFCSGDDGAATDANIIQPTSVVLDTSGNMYIGSFYDYKIRKVSTTGTISSAVGSGIGAGTSGSVDGSGTSASVNIVYGLALDSAGNIYIADTGNSKIRKLTASTGIVSTYACIGTVITYSNNIAATSSGCYYPYAVALDSSNNVYIADTFHNQVRKVTASTGIISAFAGTGTTTGAATGGYSGDGSQATSAQLYRPSALALDATGNVYISDTLNYRIRKVTISTGVITTIAGTGTATYSGDSVAATSSALNQPYGVTLDASGNVYIADFDNHRIRKVTISTGIITTIAGTGTGTYTGDGGQATSATVANPVGLYYYSSSSSVYIGDFSNRVVRKISSTGVISTVAGHTYDTTQSTSLALSLPEGVAVDSSGNVYVSEYSGNKVKKMTVSTGIVSDIAGAGSSSSNGDGAAATSAGVYAPAGLAVDASGNVYIAETLGYRIRKLTVSTGIISTVVGTGSTGSCTSGSTATSTTCKVNSPMAVEVDSSGNVYYSDSLNYKVMKYTASSGIVTTIAGSGSSSTGGDGGAATSAGINKPYGFVFDASGNIIISEYASHKVRKVTVATGFISTIAGTGTSSFSGNGGQATSATLYNPTDVAIDSYGDIYISDSGNNMIRKITVSTGIISTIAGSSTSGSYTGNNVQATSATFNTPFAIAIDSANNIYITDATNGAVRKIEGSTSSPSYVPTLLPSVNPTVAPTAIPTARPTVFPTVIPTVVPTVIPTTRPTVVPTVIPTVVPTARPTVVPTSLPSTSVPTTSVPTKVPSIAPTALPTTIPSATPTVVPTTIPTAIPSRAPTLLPSPSPTVLPSTIPSQASTVTPTSTPSVIPTTVPSTNPTVEPTAIPSTVTPSNSPTVFPTHTPTTFPTYTGSVRVTFFVFHELDVPSTNDLDISKGSPCFNALIDSVIESLNPFPIASNDVDLLAAQNVSMTTKSRLRAAASAASNTIALRYMLDLDTQIFDSVDIALGTYISALNESIVTGDFDIYLHANAAKYGDDSLNNAASILAIFTTASPTLSPTSFPTSSSPTSNPTKVNLLTLNGFETTWDPRYVKAKAQFYLASYILYFIGIYILLYLLDILGLYKQFLAKLQVSSFHSNVHNVAEHEWREMNSSIKRLAKLCKQSKELFEAENNWRASTTRKEFEPANILDDVFREEANSDLGMGQFSHDNHVRSSRFSGLHQSIGDFLRRISSHRGKMSFTPAYFRYLHNKRTLLMADPYLYPHGIESRVCCTNVMIPMGIIEDYILFMCNNHQIFSCIFGINDSSDSRSARRLIYCTQNIISFFISAFTGSIFNYFEFGVIVNQVFDALVISPISLAVADFIRYLYKLQIIFNAEGTENNTLIIKFLIKVLIVFIFLGSFVLLFLAALFTYNQNKSGIIYQYFTQVQIVCFFYEIILSTMLFVPHYHYNLSVHIPRVLNLTLVNIGQLYLEKIMKNNSNDYVCFRSSILGGLFVANYVVSRDYAFKNGWITAEELSPPSPAKEEVTVDTPKITRMSTNPLLRRFSESKSHQATDPQLTIELPVVTESNPDVNRVSFANVYATHDKSNSKVEYTNNSSTIHSNNARVQNPLLNMNKPTEVEEDDSLFQLYQSEISRVSSEGGSEDMTFEEWKIKRKQFNPNTRKTFISNYRVFEDLEEISMQRKEYMNRFQSNKKGLNKK